MLKIDEKWKKKKIDRLSIGYVLFHSKLNLNNNKRFDLFTKIYNGVEVTEERLTFKEFLSMILFSDSIFFFF